MEKNQIEQGDRLSLYSKRSKKFDISQFSIFPIKFLDRIILAKVRKHSSFFIKERDLMKLRFIGNSSIVILISFFVLFHFLTQVNIILTTAISLIVCLAYIFVFGDYVRSEIIKRHQSFDESAFLIRARISIGAALTNPEADSPIFIRFSYMVINFFFRKNFNFSLSDVMFSLFPVSTR